MSPDPVALVPIKTSGSPKLRLGHVLDRPARVRLVSLLFDHVAGVLTGLGLRVIAVGSGPIASHGEVEVWPDGGRGLNAALAGALVRLGSRALIVPADLPWLEADDVERVLSVDAPVVVARAHDGGTNALMTPPGLTPRFGERSALAHAEEARRAGLRACVVDLPSFERDLDDEAELVRAAAILAGLRGTVPVPRLRGTAAAPQLRGQRGPRRTNAAWPSPSAWPCRPSRPTSSPRPLL